MPEARKTLILAAAALAAGLSGCGDTKPTAAPAAAGPVEVGVIATTPRRVTFEADLPGRTAAFRVAEVRPQVGGIILRRAFDEGSTVKAGDLLYLIDPASYEAALAGARADVQKAEAALQAARSKAQRATALVKSSVLSRQDHDDAMAALHQTEAQLAAAKAAQESARINLDRTRVVAPIDGRIGRSEVTEGALVTTNQAAPLATIQQIDPMYVDLTQPATDLARLRRAIATGRLAAPGDRAPVTLLGEGGEAPYAHIGALQFADAAVDPGTATVRLRAVFPNPGQELLPGQFVRARIGQAIAEDAITVPLAAVTHAADGRASVWVLDGDGKAQPRPIETGATVGGDWLVTDGLAAGDRVVVEGQQKLRPGTPVKAAPPARPQAR